MALDFNAVSLTPLTDDHVRALQYLTSGWSRPHGVRGAFSSTMGPKAYRRRRRRIAAIAAGVMAAIVLLVPSVVAAVALYHGDYAELAGLGEALPYLLIAAATLSTIGAAISWFQTGGKRRTPEPNRRPSLPSLPRPAASSPMPRGPDGGPVAALAHRQRAVADCAFAV